MARGHRTGTEKVTLAFARVSFARPIRVCSGRLINNILDRDSVYCPYLVYHLLVNQYDVITLINFSSNSYVFTPFSVSNLEIRSFAYTHVINQ